MNKNNQGAIFIASFSEQLIREKVMMDEPDQYNYFEYNPIHPGNPEKMGFDIDKFNEDCKVYDEHVASRRTFPYDVKEEQDGNELREGVDFEIKQEVTGGRSVKSLEGIPYDYHTYTKDVAIPIEPDTHLRTKDELVRKGEAGYDWLNYIKQFPKLDELWNQLPNVPNVWLSQQIDIFAGKYPSKPEPDSAMGWLKKEGYPDVMPMTLDNLGIILDRYKPSSKEQEYDKNVTEEDFISYTTKQLYQLYLKNKNL